MDCDEHIILKKLRDGDSEALDILYLRYASKVRDFAFRLLKDRKADESVSTDDLLEMIDLAVRNMPEQRRRVFCMSRYENMSYNDIAEALNISPKTVQYHISGALAELRKLLSAMAFFI